MSNIYDNQRIIEIAYKAMANKKQWLTFDFKTASTKQITKNMEKNKTRFLDLYIIDGNVNKRLIREFVLTKTCSTIKPNSLQDEDGKIPSSYSVQFRQRCSEEEIVKLNALDKNELTELAKKIITKDCIEKNSGVDEEQLEMLINQDVNNLKKIDAVKDEIIHWKVDTLLEKHFLELVDPEKSPIIDDLIKLDIQITKINKNKNIKGNRQLVAYSEELKDYTELEKPISYYRLNVATSDIKRGEEIVIKAGSFMTRFYKRNKSINDYEPLKTSLKNISKDIPYGSVIHGTVTYRLYTGKDKGSLHAMFSQMVLELKALAKTNKGIMINKKYSKNINAFDDEEFEEVIENKKEESEDEEVKKPTKKVVKKVIESEDEEDSEEEVEIKKPTKKIVKKIESEDEEDSEEEVEVKKPTKKSVKTKKPAKKVIESESEEESEDEE